VSLADCDMRDLANYHNLRVLVLNRRASPGPVAHSVPTRRRSLPQGIPPPSRPRRGPTSRHCVPTFSLVIQPADRDLRLGGRRGRRRPGQSADERRRRTSCVRWL